jgi:hypothetical protein
MFLLNGFPEELLNRHSGLLVMATDAGMRNKSKALEVTTDATTTLIQAKEGVSYIVKGITVICDGNQGLVEVRGTVEGANTLLLPSYVSVQSRANASGALNLKLDENTPITFTTIGRGASKTFVGVSYVEVGGTEVLGFAMLLDSNGNTVQGADGQQLYVKVGE